MMHSMAGHLMQQMKAMIGLNPLQASDDVK
jgi:hypothetical protein